MCFFVRLERLIFLATYVYIILKLQYLNISLQTFSTECYIKYVFNQYFTSKENNLLFCICLKFWMPVSACGMSDLCNWCTKNNCDNIFDLFCMVQNSFIVRLYSRKGQRYILLLDYRLPMEDLGNNRHPSSRERVPVEDLGNNRRPSSRERVPVEDLGNNRHPSSRESVPVEDLGNSRRPSSRERVPMEDLYNNKHPSFMKGYPWRIWVIIDTPRHACRKRWLGGAERVVRYKLSSNKTRVLGLGSPYRQQSRGRWCAWVWTPERGKGIPCF